MITLRALFFSFCILALPSHCEEKSQLVTHLEAGEKQVVVAYGTSLTAAGAWVAQLTDALNQKFPGQATVINSGGSGQWSEWGVANLQKKVIQKHPDTVFIEFSINDCVERFKGSIDIAKTNLETMIDAIHKANPTTEIILMTMTPGNGHPAGHLSYRKDIDGHYEMYRSVGKARKLLLIDHYPTWRELQKKDKELFQKYVPDTIHPTAEGCAKIVTPVIFSALGIDLSSPKK
jgi:lysophospholipase L1-like esterase